jgi:cell division protease FtsH
MGFQPRSYSETTAREIDEAVKTIVDAAFARALAILKAKRAILDRGARLLLEKETLVEEDLRVLMAELPAAAQ